MRTPATWTFLVAVNAFPALCLAVSLQGSPEYPTQAADQSVYAGGSGKEPKSQSYVIQRVESRPGGEFTVTFEDGQVWQQVKPDVHLDLSRGDSVVIRRRGGTYVLESSRGLSTLVKRLR
jgi:hypothetical protein